MKIIVRKNEWQRGEETNSQLINGNKMCIMGFVGEQVYKLSKSEMNPYNTLGTALLDLSEEFDSHFHSTFSYDVRNAWEVNDENSSSEEIESRLIERFKNNGIELEFV